jgi:hypothetical protein
MKLLNAANAFNSKIEVKLRGFGRRIGDRYQLRAITHYAPFDLFIVSCSVQFEYRTGTHS